MAQSKQERNVTAAISALTVFVLIAPVLRWGDQLNWKLSDLTMLQLFPLIGLWAFGLMWTHFVVAGMKRRWPVAINYRQYYQVTGAIVLALILLHPALLVYQGQTHDFNAVDYVGKARHLYVYFAYFALSVFLVYELLDHLREKPAVQKYWPLVKAFNIAAFVAIFFHSFFLGQHLQEDWLRYLWLGYGITAAVLIMDSYHFDLKRGDGRPN